MAFPPKATADRGRSGPTRLFGGGSASFVPGFRFIGQPFGFLQAFALSLPRFDPVGPDDGIQERLADAFTHGRR